MSRNGSPSHSRRDSGHSFGSNNQSNNHSFRPRPSGLPSSSGGGGGGGGGRLNTQRVPSIASQHQHQLQASNQSAGHSATRSLSLLLGRSVKLKLIDGSPNGGEKWVEGNLWCYDPITGVVILDSPGSGKGKQTFRMVKVNQVREVQLGEPIESPPPAALVSKILEPVRPINVTAIAMREAQAVKADDARRARIGHGVSRWAQEIFDALGKTLPVRWHQTSIIILDDVMLSGPQYRPEDVKVSGNNSARLARVRQVLEGEWGRLLRTEEGRQMELEARLSSSKTAATTTPVT
ncbi:hypothetical protein O181_005414 [Austropuccinia psidii MF-1]|uniref:AD domain-containing protein n=1 Tax=Austropuccinia psidii MF-1 TaxID=1389203 RepID=A0A9Q3GFV2_9BASI|nr:hypothetical protein [Austropuccinia psidii MF-1]